MHGVNRMGRLADAITAATPMSGVGCVRVVDCAVGAMVSAGCSNDAAPKSFAWVPRS
jgi:hypothetical protein